MFRRTGFSVLVLALLVVCATAVAHTGTSPYRHTGTHSVGLPDLYADAPDGAFLEQYDFGGATGNRLLLRFNGYIHNANTAGTLEIHGATRVGSEMGVVNQREYTGAGTTWVDHPLPAARMLYETGDGHMHWHLRDAARYSLTSADASGSPVASAKVGFCLIDSTNDYVLGLGPYIPTEWTWETPTDPSHGNCGEYVPAAGAVVMGLTPGWRDNYESDLYYQWVDVSNTRPGDYELKSEVDPSNLIVESNELNAPATTDVTVPGYVAQPVDATGLSPLHASTIELESTGHSGPLRPTLAAPQFRIDEAPADGTLDHPVGTWFSATSVQYTPTPGADGSDSFRYSVRETGNPFPLTPVSATATVSLTGPAPPAEQVAVSGAPAELEVGSTAQLSAAVAHPRGTGAVTWSVDGVNGGSEQLGTISTIGLYSAPAAPPPSGTVTIRATSDTGVAASVPIKLVKPPPREPAPTDPITPQKPGTGLPGAPVPPVVPPIDPPRPPDPGPAPPPQPAPETTRTPTTKPTKKRRAKKPSLRSVRASRQGSFVVVSVVPGTAGRVRAVLMAGRRRVGGCTSKAASARRYTCRVRLRRRSGRLVVLVTLSRSKPRGVVSKRVAVRRVAVRR